MRFQIDGRACDCCGRLRNGGSGEGAFSDCEYEDINGSFSKGETLSTSDSDALCLARACIPENFALLADLKAGSTGGTSRVTWGWKDADNHWYADVHFAAFSIGPDGSRVPTEVYERSEATDTLRARYLAPSSANPALGVRFQFIVRPTLGLLALGDNRSAAGATVHLAYVPYSGVEGRFGFGTVGAPASSASLSSVLLVKQEAGGTEWSVNTGGPLVANNNRTMFCRDSSETAMATPLAGGIAPLLTIVVSGLTGGLASGNGTYPLWQLIAPDGLPNTYPYRSQTGTWSVRFVSGAVRAVRGGVTAFELSAANGSLDGTALSDLDIPWAHSDYSAATCLLSSV